MSIIALIPSRSGSKRLVNKNMLSMCGKPLIYWTLTAALSSKHVSKVYISTDSPSIAKYAQDLGAEAPFLRPRRLSQDSTLMIDVILHLLTFLEKSDKFLPDKVVLLQPTSPLRTSKDIDQAIEHFLTTPNADHLTSYTKLPDSLHPSKIIKLDQNGFIERPENSQFLNFDTQQSNSFLIRNGPAIYISKSEALSKGMYSGNNIGYEMPWNRSIDIDTESDFQIAEFLLMNHIKKNELNNSDSLVEVVGSLDIDELDLKHE